MHLAKPMVWFSTWKCLGTAHTAKRIILSQSIAPGTKQSPGTARAISSFLLVSSNPISRDVRYFVLLFPLLKFLPFVLNGRCFKSTKCWILLVQLHIMVALNSQEFLGFVLNVRVVKIPSAN